MAKLSSQQVEHVAKLAHLKLTPSEVILYQDQLSRVLEYVEKLESVDTKDTPPTYQVINKLTNVTRPDETKPPLSSDDALSQAPQTHNGTIVTKAILEV